MSKTKYQIICDNCGIPYNQTSVKVAKFICQPLDIELSEISHQDIRTLLKVSISPCPVAPDTSDELTIEEKLAFRKIMETGTQYYSQISKTIKNEFFNP